MNNKNIVDCHCHFVTLADFELYKMTSSANKFLNIRAINHDILVKPYNFSVFKDIDNMYLTEAIDLTNIEEELIRIESSLKTISRIVGIKVYLGYQEFCANDERVLSVVELANKYGVSMIFHCGECYAVGEKINYSNAKYIEDLAIKYKDVNFIASHMNWPLFDDLFELCEKYDNIYTCFSGCLDAIDEEDRRHQVDMVIEYINEYIVKYPKLREKLMYGTDFFACGEGFVDVSDYIEIINRLNVSEIEKENILYNNAFLAYKKMK